METVQDLITDKAVEIVFTNTNFGGCSHRSVIYTDLKQVSDGYSIGRTAKMCLTELGLINSEGVSMLGQKYLEIAEATDNLVYSDLLLSDGSKAVVGKYVDMEIVGLGIGKVMVVQVRDTYGVLNESNSFLPCGEIVKRSDIILHTRKDD